MTQFHCKIYHKAGGRRLSPALLEINTRHVLLFMGLLYITITEWRKLFKGKRRWNRTTRPASVYEIP